MLHLLALIGVVCISFSGTLVRLASVSPVTAAFFRAGYALPVLAVLTVFWRSGIPRPASARALAVASGAMLAFDLFFWHASIPLIGVGLSTVIVNIQVVFVGVIAWVLFGEKPGQRTLGVVAVVVLGVILSSGLGRPDAYGASPGIGTALCVLAGGCYAGFLLVFRKANRALAPAPSPLLEATTGVFLVAVLAAVVDPGFELVPTFPAHAWLITLALGSQVVGWMLIAIVLPRVPALETSVLLMAQPVLAMIWGVVIFSERLSVVQWTGCALVLAGVGSMSMVRRTARPAA